MATSPEPKTQRLMKKSEVAARLLCILCFCLLSGGIIYYLVSTSDQAAMAKLSSAFERGDTRGMIAFTSHRNFKIRAMALGYLSQSCPKEALPVFFERMEDRDLAVSMSAMKYSALHGREAAIPRLAKLLDSPDRRIRVCALVNIGTVVDRKFNCDEDGMATQADRDYIASWMKQHPSR